MSAMKIFSIYKVTNTRNQKKYIVFDSYWPQRKKDHLWAAFNPNHQMYNSFFYRAIRKHGIEAFEWEVIYQSTDKIYTLNEMESFFIKEYKSFGKNGYNMTLGGEGSCVGIFTKKRIQNMSNAQKGKRLTQETKVNIGISCAKKADDLGITKRWLLISPNGEQIEIFGLRRFCIENKLDQGNMSRVAQGKKDNHKGWKCSKL
jgi:hypothetical protein